MSCSLLSKILWSQVSKAFFKSQKITIECFSAFRAEVRRFKSNIIGCTVEWPVRNPNCCVEIKLSYTSNTMLKRNNSTLYDFLDLQLNYIFKVTSSWREIKWYITLHAAGRGGGDAFISYVHANFKLCQIQACLHSVSLASKQMLTHQGVDEGFSSFSAKMWLVSLKGTQAWYNFEFFWT